MQGKSLQSAGVLAQFSCLSDLGKYLNIHTHTQSILFGHSAGQHCSWEPCLSGSIPAAGSALLKQLWHSSKPSTDFEASTSQEGLLRKLNPYSSFVTGFLPSWCPLRDELAAGNAGGTGAGVRVCLDLLALPQKAFSFQNPTIFTLTENGRAAIGKK